MTSKNDNFLLIIYSSRDITPFITRHIIFAYTLLSLSYILACTCGDNGQASSQKGEYANKLHFNYLYNMLQVVEESEATLLPGSPSCRL